MNNSDYLIQLLKQQISEKKYLSIAEFMNLVLYHEDYGYYSSFIDNIGVNGDFMTATTSSSLFAKSLIQQINELFSYDLDKNIIEIGAGNGQLMLDILALVGEDIEKYYILERSKKLIAIQQNNLEKYYPNYLNKVIWLDNYDDVTISGVLIANEVLDALVCNQYQLINHNIYEQVVTLQDDELLISHIAINQADIANILHRLLPYNLDNNFIFEWAFNSINEFLANCSKLLTRGCILLIDYGYSEKELLTKKHSLGTIRGFKNHQLVEDILTNLGMMDITYSVNFTQVAELAIHNQFDIIDYTSQANFLINCRIVNLIPQNVDSKEYLLATNMINRLTSINQMGEVFKVIGLCKNYNFYDWLGFKTGTLAHRL